MLREPTFEAPNLDNSKDAVLHWHTLSCELITPMYGGGTVSTKVDTKMPIRASAIRGQLRFWWRLLAKHKWKAEHEWKLKDIPQKEKEIWGGIGSGDDDGIAGNVLLRVNNLSRRITENHLVGYDDDSLEGLKYVLFPAYNETDKTKTPHRLLNQGLTFDLQFAFCEKIVHQEDITKQVIETLRWWVNFGGLGFRSRKGLGAICSNQCDYPQTQICDPLSDEDVKKAGCRLVINEDNISDSALRALQFAIRKLSNFRQAPGVGRNPGQAPNRPGRSRWPEPDALRRIQKNLGYDRRHEPEHPAGNIFARSVFGLPINYQSRQEKALNIMLKPEFGERLPSPLILRPRLIEKKGQQKQYQPMALVLPYDDILNMKVRVGDKSYPIWQADAANHIRPINENGGGDPIQAFLEYFKQ